MKNTGPVTNAEYVLSDGEVIITHTDTTSRITYANPAFTTSSEYSLEECLGQPQNLVRHPDMPREAFADLWSTIQSGKTWTGIVKNRRKSGGFYWVRANVTPMMDGSRCVGYLSVRAKPAREEISHAQRVYAAIRAGRATNIRVAGGRIVDTSLSGRIGGLAHLSLRTGTWVVLGALSALLLGQSALSIASSGLGAMTWMSLVAAAVAIANMFYVQG